MNNSTLFSHHRTQTSGSDDALFTRAQAAAYLGVSPSSLATWACRQTHPIPYIKIGRSVRYRRADLDAFLEHNTHHVDAAAMAASTSVFTYAQSKGAV